MENEERFKRPSLDEMGDLVESTDPQTLRLLSYIFGWAKEELDMCDIVQIVIYDWLSAAEFLDTQIKRQAVLFAYKEEIRFFASSLRIDAANRSYSAALFMFMDFRYVACAVHAAPKSSILDIQKGEMINRLPQQAMTNYTCDLNVLLIRFFDKLKKYRILRESNAKPADNKQPA